jgi:hypothetical protein
MDNTTIKMEIEDEESTKKVHKKAKLRNSNSSVHNKLIISIAHNREAEQESRVDKMAKGES